MAGAWVCACVCACVCVMKSIGELSAVDERGEHVWQVRGCVSGCASAHACLCVLARVYVRHGQQRRANCCG